MIQLILAFSRACERLANLCFKSADWCERTSTEIRQHPRG
jgi:hypothetical protein